MYDEERYGSNNVVETNGGKETKKRLISIRNSIMKLIVICVLVNLALIFYSISISEKASKEQEQYSKNFMNGYTFAYKTIQMVDKYRNREISEREYDEFRILTEDFFCSWTDTEFSYESFKKMDNYMNKFMDDSEDLQVDFKEADNKSDFFDGFLVVYSIMMLQEKYDLGEISDKEMETANEKLETIYDECCYENVQDYLKYFFELEDKNGDVAIPFEEDLELHTV